MVGRVIMHIMRTKFIVIDPNFTDIDTHCYFDVSNGRCRASMEIYADMGMLSDVVKALEAPELDQPWPKPPLEFDECYLGIWFTVTAQNPHRVLTAKLIESGVLRADICIDLNAEESAELAEDLRHWLKNPVYHFIWKKFGLEC